MKPQSAQRHRDHREKSQSGCWSGSVFRQQPTTSNQQPILNFLCALCVSVCSVLFPLLLLTTIGCEVGPNYHAPNTRVSRSWNAPSPQPTTQATVLPTTQRSITVEEPLEVEQWWTAFHDPELDSLIHRGVAANLDVRAALYRIVQARAQRGATASQLFPQASSAGSYSRDHSEGAVRDGHFDNSFDFWQAGLDASWELDIFGGVRRSVESANASVGYAIEDRRDVMVTLLSEIALNYIELRGYQQEIAIARNNLTAQERTESVTRRKQLGGFAASLDVANAEADVATTASELPVFETDVEQSIYALERPPRPGARRFGTGTAIRHADPHHAPRNSHRPSL